MPLLGAEDDMRELVRGEHLATGDALRAGFGAVRKFTIVRSRQPGRR